MTIKDCVKKFSSELKLVTHIPAKEVEILIMYLLDKNSIWLHLNYNNEFEKVKELEKLVKQRATNYPLEYIIGKASFYGEQFIVEQGVLIPRPETELLVDNCLEILKDLEKPVKILEIGVGSGIISVMLALLVENIKIIAVDINPNALELAQKNAKKHNVLDKIEFRLSNLYENVLEDDICMTISNPPYIANDYKLPQNVEFEPKNALFGGIVGDELLKNIVKNTADRKIPYLLCEMGYDQKASLESFFKTFSIEKYSFYKDYESFDRGFTIKFKKEKDV
ncbi:peptide chain release factor N(5)-glutamine methyltransferase [Aliarcobacter vitoriensis]|uniref:peptide chain release factor N(5)-glutamine methyltransferase n=1 Tax=Aliarcobacter vitoriensis TaxID=2011099 RepID=A0A366MUL0_9BACT|nr:peptide chain release factor N(5)-glutamine methyltransferase [Aliarcobacter vitoriensis]RBQ29946.1 protein-(glutamine-N5) methyltransferase, release factor-specific [Aliarcobacter vitoriensis]